MPHVLALYEVDRVFAGPEEGGWWYDAGQLVKTIAVQREHARAVATSERLNRWLDRLQRHRRPVSSIAYDGGRYRVLVYRDIAPPKFPQERPHYE